MLFSADFMVSIKLRHACAFNLQFHFYNSIEMLLGHKDMCVKNDHNSIIYNTEKYL